MLSTKRGQISPLPPSTKTVAALHHLGRWRLKLRTALSSCYRGFSSTSVTRMPTEPTLWEATRARCTRSWQPASAFFASSTRARTADTVACASDQAVDGAGDSGRGAPAEDVNL